MTNPADFPEPTIRDGYARCYECNGEHEANYSHPSRWATDPTEPGAYVYAVICTEDNPDALTDYYTDEMVTADPVLPTTRRHASDPKYVSPFTLA